MRWSELIWGRRSGKKTPESETAVAHNFTYMQPFCISNWGHWFQCSSSWDSHSRMNMHDQGPSWGRRGASDQLWPFLSAELKFGLISFVGSTKLVPPHSWRTSWSKLRRKTAPAVPGAVRVPVGKGANFGEIHPGSGEKIARARCWKPFIFV